MEAKRDANLKRIKSETEMEFEKKVEEQIEEYIKQHSKEEQRKNDEYKQQLAQVHNILTLHVWAKLYIICSFIARNRDCISSVSIIGLTNYNFIHK